MLLGIGQVKMFKESQLLILSWTVPLNSGAGFWIFAKKIWASSIWQIETAMIIKIYLVVLILLNIAANVQGFVQVWN
jgi:hypothetical protein